MTERIRYRFTVSETEGSGAVINVSVFGMTDAFEECKGAMDCLTMEMSIKRGML